jgi:hypothetical protein
MKLSMVGQEKGDLLIQVAACAGLTVCTMLNTNFNPYFCGRTVLLVEEMGEARENNQPFVSHRITLITLSTPHNVWESHNFICR